MQRRDFLRYSALGAAAATLAPVSGMGMPAASKPEWEMKVADSDVPYETKVGHTSCTVCNLGNIAMELGRPVVWNPIVQKCMHDPEATKLLHYQYRAGYKHALDV